MRNEFPTHCVRCAEPLRSSTMSRFNTDTICLACDADERLAPGYTAAAAAELEAVRRGDRNFPGVGLSNADRLFFANRLAERRKVRPGLAGDWDDFSKSNDRRKEAPVADRKGLFGMPKFDRAVLSHVCLAAQDCAVCNLTAWIAEAQSRLATVRDVQEGYIDRIAVILKPDDARALAAFVDSNAHPETQPDELTLDRIAEAIEHGIRDYDGPDGDDGRAFTDAAGQPHYEP